MARTNNSSTPAQGSGSTDSNLFDHVVTQDDLDNNKELAESGVKVGETIQVPKVEGTENVEQEQPATLLVAETPEWVQTILDSNAAVLESNNAVITALEDLKSFADQRSTAPGQPVEPKVQLIDEDEDYEVAPGKSFRDPVDFAKEYTEGDDVTHLGVIKLQSLLNSGLIVES